MKRFLNFIIRIIKGFSEHELLVFSCDMTYKLILSIFPLIIFAMSIIGFLRIDELDVAVFIETIQGIFPAQSWDFIDNFITEVVDTRSTTVLTSTLLLTLFTASSGFASVIRGINTTYGHRDTRSWVHKRAVSMMLVLLFLVIVVLAMAVMVFSRNIQSLIFEHFNPNAFVTALFGLAGYFAAAFIILVIIVMIYKIGNCRKVKVLDVFPGAVVTVIFWLLFSQIFNVYLTHFTGLTLAFGSIASVLILLLWLNFITAFLLVGSEVNAILAEGYEGKGTMRISQRLSENNE